jgi:hypothetical protein
MIARVAKLVDAQASEVCGIKPVGVRLSSRAHLLTDLLLSTSTVFGSTFLDT